jgi:hypothetical protein
MIISIHSIKNTVEEVTADLKEQYRTLFGGKNARLVLFFASSTFEPAEISLKIKEVFGEVEVFGCTTSGELSNKKILNKSVVAMVFDDEAIEDGVIGVIENIKENDTTQEVFRMFEAHYGPLNELDIKKYVGVMLIDGVSGAEEKIMDKIGNMTDLTFIGGSAGDDMKFQETHVFHNGKSYTNAAIVALVKVRNGFEVLKTQSFTETGKVLQATKVDEENRVIEEFDNKPATEAYAEALGIQAGQATSEFMSHPVGLMVNGEPYVRSPQQSIGTKIKFFCNVKEGTELSVLTSADIVKETQEKLEEKISEMDGASGIINFHCILRTLELEKKGQTEAYAQVFSDVPMIGFSTYGEQYIGHINQTSTILLFK